VCAQLSANIPRSSGVLPPYPPPQASPAFLAGCSLFADYWWNDDEAPHGVTNLTWPTPEDDSEYITDAFERFLDSRQGAPFVAQLSFHNCHIPFIGSPEARANCAANKTCRPPVGEPYTDTELDFYACLTELDAGVGRVLAMLDAKGYGENTMTVLTTDNGPEENCPPLGICQGTEHRPMEGPGSAGPLRGRKRDIYEGGHRVPGIVSWPKVVQGNSESWDTFVTTDVLPTMMEVYGVQRPAVQEHWAFDGVSMMPMLQGKAMPTREFGWMFDSVDINPVHGYGYRSGKYKLVVGSKSCTQDVCRKPQLYDLEADLGERHDLSEQMPDMLAALQANFSAWHTSVMFSRTNESMCAGSKPEPGPEPSPFAPSNNCEWKNATGLSGDGTLVYKVSSKEECCGACIATRGCAAADLNDFVGMEADAATAGEMYCHIRMAYEPKDRAGSMACVPKKL